MDRETEARGYRLIARVRENSYRKHPYKNSIFLFIIITIHKLKTDGFLYQTKLKTDGFDTIY